MTSFPAFPAFASPTEGLWDRTWDEGILRLIPTETRWSRVGGGSIVAP